MSKDIVDDRCLKNAIDGIFCGFEWDRTKQGTKYWDQVLSNLREIRVNGYSIKAGGNKK